MQWISYEDLCALTRKVVAEEFKPNPDSKFLTVSEKGELAFVLQYTATLNQIGYQTLPQFRNKGLSSRFFADTLCFIDQEKIPMTVALVDEKNPASEKILINSGFRILSQIVNSKIFIRYLPREIPSYFSDGI